MSRNRPAIFALINRYGIALNPVRSVVLLHGIIQITISKIVAFIEFAARIVTTKSSLYDVTVHRRMTLVVLNIHHMVVGVQS